MDKNAIKKYAVWARRELISRVSQKAMQYGITSEGNEPGADSVNGKLLSSAEKRQRSALINKIKEQGFEQVMEEVAYTWFNRFAALRFMEVNGYLPSHVRVFTNDEGEFKPQILTEAIHLELEGLNMEKVYELKEANKEEELFKYLLIVQCNALNKILPGMFQKIEDYTELLLPDNLLREDSVIERFIREIKEEYLDLSQNGQVEIIGWLYQYYNSEKKDAVFAAMSNKVKVSKENIAAATQLFTPDWIVRYMVENSLGRLWVDGHADTSARSEWKYYLDEAEQTAEVQAQLAEIRAGRKDLTPEQIRFIDPCMGSGHILVYAFDVLMQIYLSCGYTERDAAQNIVRNNLWGLDLDKRAYQLAYFAVMMKARQYDRRFFTRGISPNLSHFQDLPTPDYSLLDEPIRSFVKQFENADTYGSLITVQADDEMDKALDEFEGTLDLSCGHMEHLMQLYKILSQRYDVVCTNPPYMGLGNANSVLKSFIEKMYPDSKSDFFAVFIEKCAELAKGSGYYSMITQHAWMFLSSYEKLRKKLLFNTTISMAHLGARAFDEISGEVVQTTAFVNSNLLITGYKGTYKRLIDRMSEKEKSVMFLEGSNTFITASDRFSRIPGTPVAYWVSNNFIQAFNNKMVSEFADFRSGMSTTDNERFLRFWHEVSINKIGFGYSSVEETESCEDKWFPYNKGGEYRKWFGNRFLVVNWENNGAEIKHWVVNNPKDPNTKSWSRRLFNIDYSFRESLTWTALSSGGFNIRYSEQGFMFDSKGASCFCNSNVYYICGLLNSKPSQYYLDLLCPTLDYGVGQVAKIPMIISTKSKQEEIVALVIENIDLCKYDWDSFETSWDFKEHPFIRLSKDLRDATAIGATMQHYYGDQPKVSCPLELCYLMWQGECNDRRTKLKANEEELNRIFIEIYGLQDELTPEVDDDDITVREADLQRDIRSFISYAVGCMFGRYSLDTKGLAYAGGEWDESKYTTFLPDKDSVIPICDDEYFEDDIVGRFIRFVELVYGKENLEDNLQFIASALGGKGTARDAIRSYFLNGFYSDHVKTYQKRPIYWLFDSGKKNGFKCLIYMHRYQPDTIARIRTDYVHEQQNRYRTEIENLEKCITEATTAERVKLNKQLISMQDKAKELREYEEKIHHLADQMIKIDLDDGVKHNYAIFQDVLAKIK